MQAVRRWSAERQRQAAVTAAFGKERIDTRFRKLGPARYIHNGEGTLDEALQPAREQHAARQRRLERMGGLLEHYGIHVRGFQNCAPALDAYLDSGTGDEQAVVMAVRAEKNRRDIGWEPVPVRSQRRRQERR